jgi:hypothetical protein
VNGEDGNVRILLPGGSGARTAYTREMIPEFSYVMDLSGPHGERRRVETAPGTSDVTLFLALGKWTVQAKAFLDGEPVGTGETGFTVSGRNNNVEIPMDLLESHEFVSAIDYEDFKGETAITRFTVSHNGTGEGSWAKALADINYEVHLKGSANSVITLTNDITLSGSSSDTFGNIANIKVSLRGQGTPTPVLSLNSSGNLLRLKANQTLILRNLTLQGRDDNNGPLVSVYGGSLTMYAGAKIKGNIHSNTTSVGGGVYVGAGGTFTMEDGEISGNSASDNAGYGGGVFVIGSSTFTMKGGKISGNSASSEGGGVYVDLGGTFTMEGGEISGNSGGGYGGGVFVTGGSFTMKGGEISGNTASSKGGGVYVDKSSFSKTGGVIYGDMDNNHTPGEIENTATSSGDTNGHAVFYQAGDYPYYTYYYRDATLNAGDDISTDPAKLPANATGDYDETNWIKRP